MVVSSFQYKKAVQAMPIQQACTACAFENQKPYPKEGYHNESLLKRHTATACHTV